MNNIEKIEELRKKQISFFSSGITKEVEFRKKALCRLRDSVRKNDKEIAEALRKDLNKSSFEAYATETGLVLHELRTLINNISIWASPKKTGTPLFAFPSRSSIYPEPFGLVYIISPWNYPFQLPMVPLIGAIAAGNTVIMRQSRFSPNTNLIIKKIIAESFTEEHAGIIECDVETAEEVLRLKWDFIFFTGSTTVGKKVYSEAAANMTPVILELGGKSPVIVDEDASIKLAARKIIWGKLINAGQTCVAPDYLFVNSKIKDALIEQMKLEISDMYGKNPIGNPEYPKIISEKAFDRLSSFITEDKIITGGKIDRAKLSIEPTILKATLSDNCMKEELFGPLLPVITFDKLEETIEYINSVDKPLAIYFFSKDKKKQNRFIRDTSSGACLVNDVVIYFANNNLPLGGVGNSGQGRYHGKESFRAFSNMKAVMKSSSRIDIPIKYPPFGNKERLIRMFLR